MPFCVFCLTVLYYAFTFIHIGILVQKLTKYNFANHNRDKMQNETIKELRELM